ncbi:MAG TPA: hypothetical protein PLU37_11360 [Chitinophagaceae bacterium]|nr:hypothetical protein [Chitinophagaceae bacterium]MCB9054908.1 hypothetical protein [Chitinophagales bacterium]HPG12121.1 hypothetical protein [Chitinophagaceae bacterium]HRX94147.1 hypothetical protein [Chitinophagaceae bacterium]
MEVHHHAHTARKKWHHYFWEFFMLFLAVTLGFFVENTREHFIERKREKKYIESILLDLKSDVQWTTQFIKDQSYSVNSYDSVILLLKKDKRSPDEQQRLYYLVRMAMRSSWPNEANENAYEQMKNSGNLRLLHNHDVADSISRYYFNLDEISYITTLLTLRQQAVTEYEAKIFDGSVFQDMIEKKDFSFKPPDGNPPLALNDRNVINEFFVRIHYLSSIMVYSINFAKEQHDHATRLIRILEEEYKL